MADAVTRRAFTSLIAVACVDKKVNDTERQYLYRKAREFGIPSAEADDLIRQGLEGRFTLTLPPTEAGKQALLKELIEVACVDGRIEQWESRLLMRFAAMIGVSPGDVGNRVREQLNRSRNASPPPDAPKAARAAASEPVKFIDEAPRPAERPRIPPLRVDPPVQAPVPPPRPNPFLENASVDASLPASLRNRESLLSLPPGPIKLNEPSFSLAGDLPPVTRELVKNVIRFDGRDEAVAYVQRTCGVSDLEKARAIVDKMIATDPECKAGSQKLKTGW